MMYPFMALPDGTEIVHSERKQDGQVKVYIEKPDLEFGFRHAVCWLPGYRWEDICGFNKDDIDHFEEVIRSAAHMILGKATVGRNREDQK